MLDKLKMLLGVTGTGGDFLLRFLLDDAAQAALDYCGLEALPETLGGTVCLMAADVYRNGDYGQAAVPEGPVSSVKEGEVSVSFAVQAKRPPADIYKDYHSRLNAHRKLRLPR